MSEEFRLVASLDLKEGSWDKVAAAVLECVAKTREEAGNQYYAAHHEQGNQDSLVFLEAWDNQAALENHMQTEHFKNLTKTIEPYAKGPMKLLKLTEITG